jgi:FkbM family methyltransferase
MFDPVLLLLRGYSKLYFLVKHRLHGGNLPGFGILSRWAWRDAILTADGAQIVFDHRAAANYACLFGGQFNEPETHAFVNRVLDLVPGPVGFIDVGANIGEMLVDFPRHPKVHAAWAFEPSARCASIIERSCALNGLHHVRVVTKAVGARVGQGLMPRDAASQCSTAVSLDGSAQAAAGLEQVPVTTLDAEMPGAQGEWIVLIDVEGSELDVMRGASGLIGATRPLIVFEYHEGTRQSFSLAQAQEVLGPEYQIYRLRSDGTLDRNLLHTWNCVAVHRDSQFSRIVQDLMAHDGAPRRALH